MGAIPHLKIHLRSNTYTSQKASLHLKQAFLEVITVPSPSKSTEDGLGTSSPVS